MHCNNTERAISLCFIDLYVNRAKGIESNVNNRAKVWQYLTCNQNGCIPKKKHILACDVIYVSCSL